MNNNFRGFSVIASIFGWMLFSSIGFGQEELHKKAMQYMDLNQFDSASVYFKEYYLQLDPDSSNLLGRAAFMTGRSLARSGQHNEAMVFFENSAKHFEEAENIDNAWVARGNIFSILDDLGRYKEAIELGQKTVDFFRSQNDTLSLGKVLTNVSLAYYKDGNTEAAVNSLLESAMLTQELYPESAAIAYNQLGTIWAEDLKDEKEALRYYQKSLELKRDFNNPESLSVSYNNIGISYKNLNMPDSAMVYYKKALDYGRESGQSLRILSPLINLGNLYMRQGDQKEALNYFLQAYDMREGLNFSQKLVTYLSLGKIFNQQEQTDKAIYYLTVGLELTNQEQDFKSQLDFLPELAFAFSRQSNFKKAYEYQNRYTHLSDSLALHEKDEVIADLLIQYQTAEKELALLESEQQLNAKEIQLKNRTLLMLSVLMLVLVVSGIAFILYRQKKAAEKQALLQFRLSEQKALNKIQEDRLNISRELHDNIGAQLTFVNAGLEQFLYTNESPSHGQLKLLKENLTQSMRELRKTVWLISKTSASIDEVTLKLRDVFKSAQHSERQVHVEAQGHTEKMLNEVQTTHLFRIVQEAVNNAVKYSGCKKINVQLIANNQELHLIVDDDGSGFDPDKIQYGYGLKNLEYRTKQLNGSISINPKIGKGTRIELSVPLIAS